MKDKKPTRFARSNEPSLGSRRTGHQPGPGKPSPDAKRTRSAKPNHKSPPGNRNGKSSPARPPRQGDHRTAKSGLLSRRLALTTLEAVMRDQKSLDTALPTALADARFADLSPRDKAFARLLAMTVLRHHGSLQVVIDSFMQKPLTANAQRIRMILAAGAAELILLSVPPHAAISMAVELTRLSAKTRHFDRLTNAVLRRVSETGSELFKQKAKAALNVPTWMYDGWCAAYGRDTAERIAAASLNEAALDFTVKSDPIAWSDRLEAIALPTGSLRRPAGGRIEDLQGYGEGAWWVQDAAAALPAKLLAPAPGQRVLDLCAAPGGKTAQLSAAGADVTAIDMSADRLERLRTNLDRLNLEAQTIAADATTWRTTERFDKILIDAPCTATGTIRRHPDILHLKRHDDIDRLGDTQMRLLQNAASLLTVGGTLVYCTCSLEPAECERRIDQFVAGLNTTQLRFERQPITPAEIAHQAGWITPAGDLRTFPYDLPNDTPALGGIDGFYAARLVRTS